MSTRSRKRSHSLRTLKSCSSCWSWVDSGNFTITQQSLHVSVLGLLTLSTMLLFVRASRPHRRHTSYCSVGEKGMGIGGWWWWCVCGGGGGGGSGTYE